MRIVVAAALLAVGCGARTGLDVGDDEGGIDEAPAPVDDTLCGEGGAGLDEPLELAGRVSGAAAVEVRGTEVYFAQWFFGGEVWSVPRDGGDTRSLADDRQAVNALAADPTGVWLVDVGRTTPAGELVHLSRSGRTRVLVGGLNQPGDVDMAAGRLWVAEGSNTGGLVDPGIGAVLRVDPSRGTVEHPVEGRGMITAVEPDATHVWWLDTWRGVLGRVRLDGSGAEEVARGLDRPRLLAVAAGRVFFTEDGRRILRAVRTTGGEPQTVLESERRIVDLAADTGHVYFLQAAPGDDLGTVARVSHDGSLVEVVWEPQQTPRGIALDERRVYWTGGEGDGGYVRAFCKPD